MDDMVCCARIYAQSRALREAWQEAKDEPKDCLRQDRETWRGDLTEAQEDLDARVDDQSLERLWELEKLEAELDAREEMLALHGDEVERAKKAIGDALAALEALPAAARALLERELGKRPARPAVLKALDVGFPDIDWSALVPPGDAEMLLEYLAERREVPDGRDDYWHRVVTVRRATRAACFNLEGAGGILDGLSAAQRVLSGHFNPLHEGQPGGRGRPPKGVKELVCNMTVSASKLLRGVPTQRQVDNLIHVFVNDPDSYLSTIKKIWVDSGLAQEKAEPES